MMYLLNLEFIARVWRLPVYALLGLVAGLGLATLRISEAASYLSDDPRTCVNCHVMTPQYTTWRHSSHAAVATCNDCHVPHTSKAAKYFFKAKDGLRHTWMFTFRREPQVIRAKPEAEEVIQANCLRCHQNQLLRVDNLMQGNQKCLHCHRETPHGTVESLASTPNAKRPGLASVTPHF